MDDPREIVVEFRPCNCSVAPFPHHHLSANDVMKWNDFRREFARFAKKGMTRYEGRHEATECRVCLKLREAARREGES